MVIPLAVMALGMFAAVLVPYGYPLAWVTVTVPVSEPSLFLLVHVVAGILAAWIAFAARRDAAPGLAPALVALLGILGMTALSALAVKTFSVRTPSAGGQSMMITSKSPLFFTGSSASFKRCK